MLTLDHSPVQSNPELMGGTLVFRGTRVPAQSLLDYLDDHYTLDEFLDMFPSVQRADAAEFLRLARGTPDGEYESLLENLNDLAVVAERRHEPLIPHDQFIADLKCDGKL